MTKEVGIEFSGEMPRSASSIQESFLVLTEELFVLDYPADFGNNRRVKNRCAVRNAK